MIFLTYVRLFDTSEEGCCMDDVCRLTFHHEGSATSASL